MLGIDIYGFFHIVNDSTILKPSTKHKKTYTLDVYQGSYFNCSKNIKLGSFQLPYKELWNISFSIEKNVCSVYLEDTFVSSFNLVDLNEHIKQYEKDKESDLQQEYESYIQEHKSTLYDSQIKYSIERLVDGFPTYEKLIEKFERAEQLCFIEDMTIEEYKMALKEIDSFISPIMKNIIIKHT
jgi:hypothetical protein